MLIRYIDDLSTPSSTTLYILRNYFIRPPQSFIKFAVRKRTKRAWRIYTLWKDLGDYMSQQGSTICIRRVEGGRQQERDRKDLVCGIVCPGTKRALFFLIFFNLHVLEPNRNASLTQPPPPPFRAPTFQSVACSETCRGKRHTPSPPPITAN